MANIADYLIECQKNPKKTKHSNWMTNSVDPDQLLHSAASDKGLHCLLRNNCLNNEGNYGITLL